MTENGVKNGLIVPDGTIEGLKWLGLLLMTADHVNKYLFHEQLTSVFQCGRVVMPIFAFCLAYNMARPMAPGRFNRVIKKTALYGLFATPFFIALGGLLAGWWPLNIMFMLCFAAVAIRWIEQGRAALAALAVIVGGGFVEFWWPGLLFTVVSWLYCKKPSWFRLLSMALCLLPLVLVNGNFYALAAMLLILIAPHLDLKVPRNGRLFYVFYPTHLAAIYFVVFFINK